jgi:hypothetical protein
MRRFARVPALLALSASPALAADGDTRALIDGIAFFAILFGLALFAGAMRLRDARSDLSAEQKQARLKGRLPWVMGAFFGACGYILIRSL